MIMELKDHAKSWESLTRETVSRGLCQIVQQKGRSINTSLGLVVCHGDSSTSVHQNSSIVKRSFRMIFTLTLIGYLIQLSRFPNMNWRKNTFLPFRSVLFLISTALCSKASMGGSSWNDHTTQLAVFSVLWDLHLAPIKKPNKLSQP